MRPEKLIGHRAIRTKPLKINGFLDHSYITDPILIKAVTENHIVFEKNNKYGGELSNALLDYRWIDDNWESYDYLMYMASEEYQKNVEKMTEIPNN